MTARVLRPAITFATVGAVLLAALAVYLALTGSNSAYADLGDYDATNTQTVVDKTPGAARNATTILDIPYGDYNFSNNVTFEPAGVGYTPSCNDGFGGTPFRDFNDNGVNDGPPETPCIPRPAAGCGLACAKAGTQTSDIFLGVASNKCDSALIVVHDLFPIPTPNNELDPRASTNIVFPRDEGSSNRFEGWQVGSSPGGSGTGTAVIDSNLDTRAEGASLQFQNYPSFLLDLFDPDFTPVGDGPIKPILPIALYGGSTQVTGTWVPLYYAVFAPGALATGFAGTEPNPFTRMTADLGYPTQAVLNDPTAVKANPSSITDFCTPLVAQNQLNATIGGVTRATNPGVAGTHVTLNYTSSLRDADNDGIENSFDTCPRAANTDGDPRQTQGPDLFFGQPVGDMIDSVCDPTPLAMDDTDHDNDGFTDAQDNCPLVANPDQEDQEGNSGPAGADTAAIDGGVQGDSMGNDNGGCDNSGSIVVTINNKSVTVNFSSSVANGHWNNVMNVLPTCYGSPPVDADGDGYCAGADDPADSGSCVTSFAPDNCNIRHKQWTLPGSLQFIFNSFDTDRGGGDTTSGVDPGGSNPFNFCDIGDTPPGGGPALTVNVCPEVGFDSDAFESYVGTNPAQACSQDTTLNNEPYDSWAYDFNDDTRATLSDVIALGDVFNKYLNQATVNPFTSAVTLNGNIVADDVSINYTSAGDPIAVGDYVTFDAFATGAANEIVKVTGVDTATNTLTVLRGQLGSTAAAQTNGDAMLKTAGPRKDITTDGLTSLSDAIALGAVFNKQCRRDDGTFGGPQ